MEFSDVGMEDRTVTGNLKLKLTADLDRFLRNLHKARIKIDSFKLLRRLQPKLRTKLRNAIWRNK